MEKHIWGGQAVYTFHPLMQDVYKTIQQHGYALTDVPLESASPEMKERVFQFCIDVMK